jgi:hypothetical protein
VRISGSIKSGNPYCARIALSVAPTSTLLPSAPNVQRLVDNAGGEIFRVDAEHPAEIGRSAQTFPKLGRHRLADVEVRQPVKCAVGQQPPFVE